ncbi:hypothetical protein [Neobacillus soli]|nr:hypothetical protein [Neobacillus soli]
MNIVGRLKEKINILLPGKELQEPFKVVWSANHNNLEVLEPGIATPRIKGEEGVKKWLQELPADITFWIEPFGDEQEYIK